MFHSEQALGSEVNLLVGDGVRHVQHAYTPVRGGGVAVRRRAVATSGDEGRLALDAGTAAALLFCRSVVYLFFAPYKACVYEVCAAHVHTYTLFASHSVCADLCVDALTCVGAFILCHTQIDVFVSAGSSASASSAAASPSTSPTAASGGHGGHTRSDSGSGSGSGSGSRDGRSRRPAYAVKQGIALVGWVAVGDDRVDECFEIVAADATFQWRALADSFCVLHRDNTVHLALGFQFDTAAAAAATTAVVDAGLASLPAAPNVRSSPFLPSLYAWFTDAGPGMLPTLLETASEAGSRPESWATSAGRPSFSAVSLPDTDGPSGDGCGAGAGSAAHDHAPSAATGLAWSAAKGLLDGCPPAVTSHRHVFGGDLASAHTT